MSGLMFMDLIFRNSYMVNYNLPYNYGYAVFRKMPEVSELCRLAFTIVVTGNWNELVIVWIDKNIIPLFGWACVINGFQ